MLQSIGLVPGGNCQRRRRSGACDSVFVWVWKKGRVGRERSWVAEGWEGEGWLLVSGSHVTVLQRRQTTRISPAGFNKLLIDFNKTFWNSSPLNGQSWFVDYALIMLKTPNHVRTQWGRALCAAAPRFIEGQFLFGYFLIINKEIFWGYLVTDWSQYPSVLV